MVWHHTVWPEAQLVYTSVAKVANTSIKTALLETFIPDVPRRAPHGKDIPYLAVKVTRIRERYPTYCHFAVVRDPFDRLVSFWADKIDGPTELLPSLARLGMRKGMSFADTLQIVAATDDIRADGHFRAQSYLLTDRRGRLRPHLVLRFERLNEDWDLLRWLVAERTGADIKPLPRRRVSDHRHYSSYYDDELWAMAAERYATDLALLGYPAERAPTRAGGDPAVDAELGRILARRPGAAVLDLTCPTLGRIELVESGGGHYLGIASGAPHGQLGSIRALETGHVPEAAFDVVVVRRAEGGPISAQQRVVERFVASGRTVVTSHDRLSTMIQQRAERGWRRLRAELGHARNLARRGARRFVRELRTARSRMSTRFRAG